jgi:hypothetical protein
MAVSLRFLGAYRERVKAENVEPDRYRFSGAFSLRVPETLPLLIALRHSGECRNPEKQRTGHRPSPV